jgi:hypothetical protein
MRASDLRFYGVGVAGFEPTASSSRSNAGGSETGGPASRPPAEASLMVRTSSHRYAVIVTQFVTHAVVPGEFGFGAHHPPPGVIGPTGRSRG